MKDHMQNTHWIEADLEYMEIALLEAKKAVLHDDVPVGAVIVNDRTGEIIAACHNTRECEHTAIGHAELLAVQQACHVLDSWRLKDCTMYVTLEPCSMCAGALIASRIPRIVCGAKDPVAGAMGSVWSLHTHPNQIGHPIVDFGCREIESKELLQAFFKKKRN